MGLDYPVGRGQAEPGPFDKTLRCKKRLKDMLIRFLVHARPCILDYQTRIISGLDINGFSSDLRI